MKRLFVFVMLVLLMACEPEPKRLHDPHAEVVPVDSAEYWITRATEADQRGDSQMRKKYIIRALKAKGAPYDTLLIKKVVYHGKP